VENVTFKIVHMSSCKLYRLHNFEMSEWSKNELQ
jgi:hypothetical protein